MNRIKRCIEFVKSLKIRMEPIIFVLAMCNTVRGVLSPHLSEAKMKRTYSAPPGLHGKDLDKFYNKKMVIWDQNYSYVNLPIACIFGIIYGGYSDHYGRKIPLLIGMLSVLIDNAFYMLVWSESINLDLKWLYVSATISGLLGDFMLLMSCVNAYLSDQFGNKRELSFRMVIVSSIFSAGSFLGSLLTNFLINIMAHLTVMILVQISIFICFIISWIILENIKPERLIDESTGDESTSDEIEEEYKPSAVTIVIKSFKSIVDSIKVFITNRDGHRRAFLYLSFMANFLDQLVFGEEKSLIGTYTRLSPFNWDTPQYATYKTIRPIGSILGMLFGLVALKKFLSLRDTTIITMSISSMGICCLIIGLAVNSWQIYVSLIPDSLHGLLNPLTYTFITCLVEPNEIGKTFAVSTIAQKLAGIVQTAVLQTIYTQTVDWYQGFVWLVMAGLSGIGAIIYLIVCIIARKDNIGT